MQSQLESHVSRASRTEPIRVLVVDDSAVVRRLVTDVLAEDPDIEVVGIAPNGSVALAKIDKLKPDVITLDVEMPVMDGMATLRELQRLDSKPRVVMFSTLTERAGQATLEALSLGADDYVTKPTRSGSMDSAMENLRPELIAKVKQFFRSTPAEPAGAAHSGAMRTRRAPRTQAIELVAIGVSTGGPAALAEVIPALPADLRCPVVITQHMPPMFTRLLAERLSSKSKIQVREAADGMKLEPGVALIARGDYHLQLVRRRGEVVAELDQGPPENSCRPAVDVMCRSISEVYGARALAVILTGMGKDGLLGIEQMKQKGSPVVAQDKGTSVVWGMPGYVVEAGLADSVAPLDQVAPTIMRYLKGGRR